MEWEQNLRLPLITLVQKASHYPPPLFLHLLAECSRLQGLVSGRALKERRLEDCAGRPGAKTPCCQGRGHGFNPWQRNPWGGSKTQTKKKIWKRRLGPWMTTWKVYSLPLAAITNLHQFIGLFKTMQMYSPTFQESEVLQGCSRTVFPWTPKRRMFLSRVELVETSCVTHGPTLQF